MGRACPGRARPLRANCFCSGRARADQALRESEERFRFSLHAAQVGTWDWDILTGAVRWSDNVEVIHGRRPGTFGSSFEEFLKDVHPDYREPVQQAVRRAIEGDGNYHIEYLQPRRRDRRLDGSERPCHF